MDLKQHKVSRIDLLKHLESLESNWTHPTVENEFNLARVFHEYCRENNVLLNFTDPEHFEHFVHTKKAMSYGNLFYNIMDNRRRPEATILGLIRKVWLEEHFDSSILRHAGFALVPTKKPWYTPTIEWQTSDESLATFGPGNPPYDNAARFLLQTRVSNSANLRRRVLETLIADLWGKNNFARYCCISKNGAIDPNALTQGASSNLQEFKDSVARKWKDLSNRDPIIWDLEPLLIRWVYYNSGLYDPRTLVALPPSEEKDRTLQVELTTGCKWNKCTFCNLYKDIPYSRKELSAVKHQLSEIRNILPHTGFVRAFLSGGDSLSADHKDLMDVSMYILDNFPAVQRISTYASAASLAEKTVGELKELRNVRLSLVYFGLETGLDKLRKLVNKPVGSRHIVKVCDKLKQSEIDLSVMVMVGLGGKEYYKTHVKETAKVLNRLAPRYVAFLNTVAFPGTEYQKKVDDKKIIPLGYLDSLQQTKDIIDELRINATMSMSPVFVADNPVHSIRLVNARSKDRSHISEAIQARIDYLKGADYRILFE